MHYLVKTIYSSSSYVWVGIRDEFLEIAQYPMHLFVSNKTRMIGTATLELKRAETREAGIYMKIPRDESRVTYVCKWCQLVANAVKFTNGQFYQNE